MAEFVCSFGIGKSYDPEPGNQFNWNKEVTLNQQFESNTKLKLDSNLVYDFKLFEKLKKRRNVKCLRAVARHGSAMTDATRSFLFSFQFLDFFLNILIVLFSHQYLFCFFAKIFNCLKIRFGQGRGDACWLIAIVAGAVIFILIIHWHFYCFPPERRFFKIGVWVYRGIVFLAMNSRHLIHCHVILICVKILWHIIFRYQ